MRAFAMLLAGAVVTAYVVAGIFSIGASSDLRMAMAPAGAPPRLVPEGTVPLGVIVTAARRDAAGRPVLDRKSKLVVVYGKPAAKARS